MAWGPIDKEEKPNVMGTAHMRKKFPLSDFLTIKCCGCRKDFKGTFSEQLLNQKALFQFHEEFKEDY